MAETETKTQNSQPASGNQGVQLGIGTLIIIALIVTTCSGRGEIEKVQKDTAEIKKQLGAIDGKLDALARSRGISVAAGTEAPASQAQAGVARSRNP